MKLLEARLKIKNGLKEGFIILFKRVVTNTCLDERIPEYGEELFKTEDEAWEFAQKLAKKSKGEYVEFYVTDGRFKPVEGYKSKMIQNY